MSLEEIRSFSTKISNTPHLKMKLRNGYKIIRYYSSGFSWNFVNGKKVSIYEHSALTKRKLKSSFVTYIGSDLVTYLKIRKDQLITSSHSMAYGECDNSEEILLNLNDEKNLEDFELFLLCYNLFIQDSYSCSKLMEKFDIREKAFFSGKTDKHGLCWAKDDDPEIYIDFETSGNSEREWTLSTDYEKEPYKGAREDILPHYELLASLKFSYGEYWGKIFGNNVKSARK